MIARKTTQSDCGCKVGRIIDKYDLSNLNKEFVKYNNGSNMSLRGFAMYINHCILESEIESSTADIFNSEKELFGAFEREEAVAAIYEALKDEETPPDRRARVKTRLKQADIDINSVEGDWITHPTVRRHLRECLNIDTSSEQTINLDDAVNIIEWARSRCIGIVERTFERLQLANEVKIADPEVTISIRLTCLECNETYNIDQLLTQDNCGCYERG